MAYRPCPTHQTQVGTYNRVYGSTILVGNDPTELSCNRLKHTLKYILPSIIQKSKMFKAPVTKT